MTEDDPDLAQIRRPVVRLQAFVLGISGAVLGGSGLFVMTVWLLVKGGEQVGPHLSLLGQYFPGYSVTWGGAFLGLAYGALVGAVVGAMIGWIYNLVAAARHRG